MRVLSAHVAVSAAQRHCSVLVHRGGAQREDVRVQVGNRRRGAADSRARVVIGQSYADRVDVRSRVGRVVVKVLVREAEAATRDRQRYWNAFAPVDRQRVSVLSAHVAVSARQSDDAVLVLRCRRDARDHWCHVVHSHRKQAVKGNLELVVGTVRDGLAGWVPTDLNVIQARERERVFEVGVVVVSASSLPPACRGVIVRRENPAGAVAEVKPRVEVKHAIINVEDGSCSGCRYHERVHVHRVITRPEHSDVRDRGRCVARHIADVRTEGEAPATVDVLGGGNGVV